MKRDIVIDADHILFLVTYSKTYDDGFEEFDMDNLDGMEDFEETKVDLEPYKNHFKAIIDDYVMIAEVESICHDWTIGKLRVIMSDHTNFRYKLYGDYKGKREERTDLMGDLKKWAMKEYSFEKKCEADDVVAYYVRKGGLGFTTDKDLFAGVAGIWYNCHYKHRNWVHTGKLQAEYFFKCQLLAGDPVDNIPSLPKVGLPTAQKLMKEHGSSYEDIEKIFKLKGFSKEYMTLMGRLVSMSQWSPKKGIKLWKGGKY